MSSRRWRYPENERTDELLREAHESSLKTVRDIQRGNVTALQPVEEVARLIASGGAFRDEDAVRVAREYLRSQGIQF